jgi:hypothetical protein
MNKLIISYDIGYNNWYVSEFYKFFHQTLSENSMIKFEYVPLKDLAIRYGKELSNHTSSVFNWYNLIILNPKTEKFFIHSWYDYATEIPEFALSNNINLVKFSCVSNLTEEIIEKYKGRIKIQPSVYYLENWSDLSLIEKFKDIKLKKNKSYFNGLIYGYRENIKNTLSKIDFFDIKNKNNPNDYQNKTDYYQELSSYKFGLSLNGAANICYRDLELFGLGVLNLRQPLKSKTFNPLIKDIHYIEFLDNDLFNKIIKNENVNQIINEKINQLLEFESTNEYSEMITESKKWFLENINPRNQFNILKSFLDDYTILV